MFLFLHFILFTFHYPTASSLRDPAPIIAWAKIHEIQHPKVDLVPYPSNQLILRASDFIKSGELLVRVPRIMLWTAEDIDTNNVNKNDINKNDKDKKNNNNDPIQNAINSQSIDVQKALRANGQCLMAVRLLHARHIGIHSKFYPYVQSLPIRTRLPIHFKDELLEIPNNVVFKNNALKNRATLELVYDVLHLKNGVFDALSLSTTLNQFLDAWSVVASRSFGVRGALGSVATLVPFADYANHDNAACDRAEGTNLEAAKGSAYHGNSPGSDFIMHATKNYEKGEIITVCYHKYASNSLLLSNWGFTLPNNQRDYVMLQAIAKDSNKIIFSKFLTKRLNWTNTCLFSNSSTLSQHWMVSKCQYTIGMDLLDLSVLQKIWFDSNCDIVANNSKCNATVLEEKLIAAVDAKVKKTDIISVIIGKLLQTERDLMKKPNNIYARKVIGQVVSYQRDLMKKPNNIYARKVIGQVVLVGIEDQEENELMDLMDVVHLLRIRDGVLNLVRNTLKVQVGHFAVAHGLKRPVGNDELGKLVDLLRITFDKKKKKATVKVEKKNNYFYCSKSGYFYLLDDQNQTYWDPLKWKMYVDERDELYYSSEVTGETVWELP